MLPLEPRSPNLNIGQNPGDNALATLADLNTVAKNVQYNVIGVELTQALTSAPSLFIVNIGCNEPPCARVSGTCNCFTSEYVSAGIYRLTFLTKPNHGYNIVVGAMSVENKQILIVKESSISFLVKTFNTLSGAFEDNILNNNYIEIKLWVK